MKAVDRGDVEVVKLLLNSGKVDVDAKDSQGSTALIRAAAQGSVSVVKLLLDTGKIKVEAKNDEGATALMLAEKDVESYGESSACHEIVRLLESYVHQD
jgi:ankyrin repeat protein